MGGGSDFISAIDDRLHPLGGTCNLNTGSAENYSKVILLSRVPHTCDAPAMATTDVLCSNSPKSPWSVTTSRAGVAAASTSTEHSGDLLQHLAVIVLAESPPPETRSSLHIPATLAQSPEAANFEHEERKATDHDALVGQHGTKGRSEMLRMLAILSQTKQQLESQGLN